MTVTTISSEALASTYTTTRCDIPEVRHLEARILLLYHSNGLWEPPTLIQTLANHSLGDILC
jgi:hypothetical protein